MSKQKQAVLTDKDIASILEGGLEAKAGEQTPEAVAAEVKRLADEAAEAERVKAAAAAPAAGAPVAAPAAGAPAADKDTVAPESEVVKLLKAQLKEKEDALIAATIAKRDADAKLSTVETTQAGLLDIARGSVGRMRIALGASAGDATTLDAVQVLSEHARLSAEFQKKFKVGGVADTSRQEKVEQGSVAADPSHAARIAAARP